MQLTIEHITEYTFDKPQRLIVQSHRIYPSDCESQRIINWQVEVLDHASAHFGQYFHDGAGDCLRTLTINEPLEKIKIRAYGVVNTLNQHGIEKLRREQNNPLIYLRSTPNTKANEALIDAAQKSLDNGSATPLEQAHVMMNHIHNHIRYQSGSTDHSFTAAQAYELGTGVCQDQTHCLVTIARLNNFPARYVTGYLFTESEAESHNASHAWAEILIPDLGWVGFDATNNCCPDEKYVRIGSGMDAIDAALIRSISRGVGEQTLDAHVKISAMQQ